MFFFSFKYHNSFKSPNLWLCKLCPFWQIILIVLKSQSLKLPNRFNPEMFLWWFPLYLDCPLSMQQNGSCELLSSLCVSHCIIPVSFHILIFFSEMSIWSYEPKLKSDTSWMFQNTWASLSILKKFNMAARPIKLSGWLKFQVPGVSIFQKSIVLIFLCALEIFLILPTTTALKYLLLSRSQWCHAPHTKLW